VDNRYAIVNGALANNSVFFGSATAEISAAPTTIVGGWNSDNSGAPNLSAPWNIRGGYPDISSNTGLFAYLDRTGNAINYHGHRTILSGY
jgi:hypothetical protein